MSEVRKGYHCAFFVLAKVLGPSDTRGMRIAYSWEGWPSDGGRKVRRVMAHTHDGADVAKTAETIFLAWLNAAENSDGRRYVWQPQRATFAGTGPDSWAVLIEPEMIPVAQ